MSKSFKDYQDKPLQVSEPSATCDVQTNGQHAPLMYESMKRYTKDEINAMIDCSEREIAEGRVYDFDEAMDDLEKEFAEEDRELEMV